MDFAARALPRPELNRAGVLALACLAMLGFGLDQGQRVRVGPDHPGPGRRHRAAPLEAQLAALQMDLVSDERLAAGALYPPVSALRQVTREIALRVVCQARDCGVGRAYHDEQIAEAVDGATWFPAYVPYVAVGSAG